ncbi:MAG: M23 family metallopeptidase [Nitrospirae bacterium]|uniref:M23 family metallopeptidase n=1 Tax=Candidatus Magnetobacterium casense TaxID=1455061 RepID=UPI0009DF954B|nr:M23 family metallopeptidase [Candidatus Magnetobacterium casensis]MBF0337196.1 M23 family metallopeptidase [Nitrospirota bacterium]
MGRIKELIRRLNRFQPHKDRNRPMLFFSMVFVAFLSMTHFTLDLSRPVVVVSSKKVSPSNTVQSKTPQIEKIRGFIKKGETLYDITKKYGLKTGDLLNITRAAKDFHDLRDLRPTMSYRIVVDRKSNDILELKYAIDDTSYLTVSKKLNREDFQAQMTSLTYETRVGMISGEIKSNLIESIGTDKEHVNVAYELADVFAYDIDFTTDLRKSDKYQIIIEERFRDNIFIGYGNILYASFVNDGEKYEAFRYTYGDTTEYFRANGNSVKKALMRAPLNYRYISSFFSYNRMHPILKIARPHLGVDYVAPSGTPVSAAGDGTVIKARYNGQYGNNVWIDHHNGYVTCYGHLLRYPKNLKVGSNVQMGQIIGYVGATGLATGSHLDYRVNLQGKAINPLVMKLPTRPIPANHKKAFATYVAQMRSNLDKSMLAANIK